MLPIKDVTKGMLFHLAGVMMSHALCQRSSIGFPVLAPHVYSYIVAQPEDETTSVMKKEHIPLDASTALLHEFISDLELCNIDVNIQTLLEESNPKSEAFWQIINSSEWLKERVIDIKGRDFLLQHLVSHELLTARRNEIDDLHRVSKLLGSSHCSSNTKNSVRSFLLSLRIPYHHI